MLANFDVERGNLPRLVYLWLLKALTRDQIYWTLVQYHYALGGNTPRSAAMRTNSANDPAAIFSMI